MREITSIAIHCSDSPFGDAALIDSWHRQQGWLGIGYHAVILNGHRDSSREYDSAADGLVEEGRSLELAGAHVLGHNEGALGLCLIGQPVNGVFEPTPAQVDSLLALVRRWMHVFRLPASAVLGHREYSGHVGRVCPGFKVSELRSQLGGFE